MKAKKTDLVQDNKVFLYIAAVTATILSIPLVMTNISSGWDWQLPDFLIMGTLIFGTGSLFILVARVTPKKYRIIIGLGFFALLFAAWVHLAVGIVDTWPLAGS